MHRSVLLIAALATATSLAQEPDRPRIYFPRNVVRQFFNNTITQTTPLPTITTSTSSQDKRQSGPEDIVTVVNRLTVVVPPVDLSTTDVNTGSSPSSVVQPTTSSGASSGSSSGGSDSASPSTIIGPSTVISSGSSSTGTPLSLSLSLSLPDLFTTTTSIQPPSSSTTSLSTIDVTSTSTQEPTTTPPTSFTLPTLIPTTSSDPQPTTPSPTTNPEPTTTPFPTTSPELTTPGFPTSSTTNGPSESPSPTSSSIGEPQSTTPTSAIPTEPGSTTSTSQGPTDPPSSSSSATPTGGSSETPGPTSSSTFVPTSTGGSSSDDGRPSSTGPPPTSSATPGPPSSSLSSTQEPVTSIPIDTSTTTRPYIPTTIVMQPSTSPVSASGTSQIGIPSGLPKAITPDNVPDLPDDMVEIQITLDYGFNWNFTVNSAPATAQLAKYIPMLLAKQSKLNDTEIKFRRMLPLDLSDPLGYVATRLIAPYPKALLAKLRVAMHIPTEPFFNHEDILARNISEHVNTAVDILVGSTLAGGVDIGNGGSGTGSNPNDVFNNGGGSDPSASQRGTTAGIAVGAVAVAAAYGAAMFLIARRYKRKKSLHRRASSMGTDPSTMRQTDTSSPALMGGALLSRDFTSNYGAAATGAGAGVVAGGAGATIVTGNQPGGRDSQGSGRSGGQQSGRSNYISAPMAAENSLGWN